MFDAAFDPAATSVTANGEVDLAHWKQMAQGLVERGTVISNLQMTTTDGETAILTAPGEALMQLAATAQLREGKVARVEPTDPSRYADLSARNT